VNGVEPFFVVAQRRAKEGKREELLEAIDWLMNDAREAEGFLSVDVIEAVEDPRYVVHYETWESQEAHDRYVMGPVHVEFAERTDGLLEELKEPQHYALVRRYEAGGGEGRGGLAADGAAPTRFPPRPERPRLPYASEDGVSPEVKGALRKVPARLRVFDVLAHAETAFAPVVALTDALLGSLELHPRLRQLAILRVSSLTGCEYEWAQHSALAREVGVTEEQIAAVRRGETDAPILNGTEKLVLRFATEAHSRVRVSDETFAEARERFSPREIVELLLVVGFYEAMARVMRSTDLPVEEPSAGNALG